MTKLWSFEANTAEDQALRTRIFNLIAPKENWKGPILANIHESDFDACNQAALWFTGGPIQIVSRGTMQRGMVQVSGRGYYHHIGA